MQTTIRMPLLSTIAAGILAILLFAGRWGLAVETQTQSLGIFGNILYELAFQIRFWLIAGLGLCVLIDLSRRDSSHFLIRARHRGTVAAMLLFFVLLAGAAFTQGSTETLTKVIEVVGLAVTVLAIFYIQNHRPGADQDLHNAMLLFCFLLGTALSLVAIATSDLTQRAAVGDGGPNTFVRIVGVAAISCIAVSRIPAAISFIATAGYLSLIILTQSRGGLFAFLIAVGLQFVWVFGFKRKIIYGGVALVSLGIMANYTATGNRCVEIVDERVFSQTFVYNYTAGRDQIFPDSWDIWNEHFILGNGLNGWWDQLSTYPHNIVLEIGCDSGLIGVAIFTSMIVIFIGSAARCKTPESKSIACTTLFYFLAAQFSGDIYDSRGFFYFGAMLSASQFRRHAISCGKYGLRTQRCTSVKKTANSAANNIEADFEVLAR